MDKPEHPTVKEAEAEKLMSRQRQCKINTMKPVIKFSICSCVFFGFIFFNGCKSNDSTALPPTLTTTEVSSITNNSAKCGGNITSDAGSSVTARGVCWSTNTNPTIVISGLSIELIYFLND